MCVRARALLCRKDVNKHQLSPLRLKEDSCKWMKTNQQTENRWKRNHLFFLKEKTLHASLQIWQLLVSCKLCFCLLRDGWITIFYTTQDHVLEKGPRQNLAVGLDKISEARSVLSCRDDGGNWRRVIFAVQPLFCIGTCMKDINTLSVQIRSSCLLGILQGEGLWLCVLLSLLVQELKFLVLRWLLNYPFALLYVIGDFCSVLLSFLRAKGTRCRWLISFLLQYPLGRRRTLQFPSHPSSCELDAALWLWFKTAAEGIFAIEVLVTIWRLYPQTPTQTCLLPSLCCKDGGEFRIRKYIWEFYASRKYSFALGIQYGQAMEVWYSLFNAEVEQRNWVRAESWIPV